ncbi:hypothetical protein RCOM_1428050 [Ricinus communis]|uniref:Uncharacterized protein n=1 Tax=Ricinus communis TaxID=3988 RepID=B9RES1_RICCO|nr:hypothetical protein RCOM_1428050 [Ricinus communis]
MVPGVVQTIIDVSRKVIGHGANRVVVPRVFQMGCSPGLLTSYATSSVLDAHGCLKDFNNMLAYHNDLLKTALEGLRKEFPDVHVIYADT